MTATALILSVLGAFTAFTDTEPIYNALGVLLLIIGLRMFIKLTRRGILSDNWRIWQAAFRQDYNGCIFRLACACTQAVSRWTWCMESYYR